VKFPQDSVHQKLLQSVHLSPSYSKLVKLVDLLHIEEISATRNL